MQQGYIKLYRKITHNVIFNNYQLYRLWSLCLLNASYKERDVLIDGQVVKVKPGQWIVGRFSLFDIYNNGLSPKDKVKSEKTPYRWLEKLEKLGYLTLEKTNKYTVVNVVNWGFYQGDDPESDQQNDQQLTIKRPSNDHQMTTNKKVKKDKNEKNKDMSIQQVELFESWWNLYNNKKGRVKCETKFYQLLKKYDYVVIAEGTKRYIQHLANLKANGEFVPQQKNPLTFLNGEHFNDEYVILTSNQTEQPKPQNCINGLSETDILNMGE